MFNTIKEACFSAHSANSKRCDFQKIKMYLPLAGHGTPNEHHFNITDAAMGMLKENWRFWLRNTCKIYKIPHSFGCFQYLISGRIVYPLVDLAQK